MLDELRLQDLDRLTDRQLEEDFVEIERARRALEAERLRRLAAIERRGTFKDDGYLSPMAWLVHRFQETPAVAGRDVHVATALEEMPETSEALANGELAPSAVPLLVSARETNASMFAEAEAMLVDGARTLDPRDFRTAVAYWRQSAEAEAVAREEEREWERRRLHVYRTVFGMVRVDGDLDAETGQTLITALRAVEDAETRAGEADDDRAPGQRRADALGVICRGWLDRPDRAREPAAALPASPPARPPLVLGGDVRRSPGLPATGRIRPGRPGTARRR